MDWSNELITEILHLYEQESMIWNPKHEEHKDRNTVHDSWKRIKMKFSDNYPLKDIKKKRDALMATYRKLHTRVKASIKIGSGADEIFKPDWFAHEQMAKFLQSVYTPRKTKSSENATDIGDNETETQDYEFTNVELTENNMGLTESQSLTSESTSNVDPFRAPTDAVMSGNKKRKIEKKSNTEKRMDEAYNILKIMSEKPDQDECSLYTELLCRKLKALNENTREIAMHEIDNIMYRLKQQQNRPPYSVPPQSNFANVENFQYGISPEIYHHSHSHLQLIPGFQPSPYSHSQSSPGFSPFPHSHSLPSPGFPPSSHSHSLPSPEFPPSPYSHSQPSPGWEPSPQSYSQPSPHSYSQSSLEDMLQENRDNDKTDICHLK